MDGTYSLCGLFANANFILKNLPAILASLMAGLCSALPPFFNRAETLRSVGSAIISDSPSPLERLAVFAFHFGGEGLVVASGMVLSGLSWGLLFFLLFWGAGRLGRPLRRPVIGLVWLILLAFCTGEIRSASSPAGRQLKDPRLTAPLALVDLAKSRKGRIFMNASVRPAVAVLDENILDRSLPEKSVPELGDSPEKWRNEDRANPFSAVLIGGRVSEAGPLIRHLRESPDWYLARVDNQGLLFLRGEKPDLAASPIPEFASPGDRAVYLAQYSLNLEAAGFGTLAASSMEEALSLSGKDCEILFRASSLAASQGRWERARRFAGAAVKSRPGSYEADYLLALSLLETRAFDKSYEGTSTLLGKYPDDPNVLLLHARAARAAHDFSEETKCLEHLLQIAKSSDSPTARIQVYLAQSWAQRGFPDQALSHYQAALDEGLSVAEARDVRAAMATISDSRLKR